jgi:hypothetical protein
MEHKSEKKKQIHRNTEQQRELVNSWKASGKTKKEWCQQNGVAFESIRRWVKRLHNCSDEQPLVEICKPSELSNAPVHVRVRKDGDIELYGDINEEFLRRVMHVVREAADVH